MPNVAFERAELKALKPQYDLIRDCLAGEEQVKYRRTKYLPQPNPTDLSEENTARYAAYIRRALFYNVAQRTLAGLSGQVFMRDPNVEVPEALQPLIDDATGSGVDMQQLAQLSTDYVMPFGRCGLYVDYPDTGDAGASVADVQSGKVRPTVQIVAPWDAINWREAKRGAETVLTLVVFREDYTEEDDGFETKTKSQYRVLRLDNDVYRIEIYRDKNGGTPVQSYTPQDAAGNNLDRIPFKFIGSTTNEARPSLPPMYDICSVNMAHYRNSADYEDAVFMLGQPTPVASGLTEEWALKVLNGKMMLGSRGIVMLPVGGKFELAQVQPNTMAKEAMDQKEAMMLALGAKLVEGSQVQRTATEASFDNVSENSVLSTVAKNVSAAIKWALEVAALFVGATGEIAYDMNTEFDLVNLSPEERKMLVAEWQAGAITFEEMRASLRRAGVAYLSDEEAKEQLDKEGAEALDKALKEAEGLANAQNVPDPNAPPSGDE